jgi:16S rRNA A1518/A1519 N6-dimethyltransferase RsmA/KsgA/DIM1 with predicted DNA glycosylase/AP lyase activity
VKVSYFSDALTKRLLLLTLHVVGVELDKKILAMLIRKMVF